MIASATGLGAQTSRTIAAIDSAARPEGRNGNVLGRLVSIHFDDLPLGLALSFIAQEGHLRLSYSSDVVPVARRVSVARGRPWATSSATCCRAPMWIP
jgi:hypothetical protein